MTNETKIKHLRRTGISYMAAGVCVLAMGIPYWFFGKSIYEERAMHKVFGLPFLQQVNNLPDALLQAWGYNLGGFLMFAAAYSLWKIGEPTGWKKRNVLLIPLLGTVCHFFSIMFPLPFAPLGTFLNALGMVVVGIVSVKANIWTGWQRFTPLLMGLFPFTIQFPLLFILGTPPTHIMPLWGIAFFLLGVAAWQRTMELKLCLD
ncbi:MAG TPA: hypothetical protein DCM71_20955 [Runella sp.]|nr:hypothetical protein [Runella sp.]